MKYKDIIYEKKGPIAYITLNRPEKLNALATPPPSPCLMDEWEDAVMDVDSDDNIRVCIIKGAGRGFSSGYDIGPNPDRPESIINREMNMEKYDRMAHHQMRYFYYLWDNRKPFIAQVHGFCLAGANDMSGFCDISVAAENAVFGYPVVRQGDITTTQIWPWLIGMKHTRELMYTGNMISAQQAYDWGLVNKVVPLDKLEEEVHKYAEAICNMPAMSVRLAKVSVNQQFEIMGIRPAIRQHKELKLLAGLTMGPEKVQYQKIFQEEGLKAALEWRDSRFSPTAEAGLRARKI